MATTSRGIVYPCGTDAINCTDFATNALSEEAALAVVDAAARKARLRPAVAVTALLGQLYTVGVPLVIVWGTSFFDTFGMFSNAAPTVMTCRAAGIYSIGGRVNFALSAANTAIRTEILVNGTMIAQEKNGSGEPTQAPFNNTMPQILAPLALNDTVSVRITVSGGAVSDTFNAQFACTLMSFGGF